MIAKLLTIWTLIKDNILKWGFVASSVALAVMYFLYDRRGRRLSQALADAQKLMLQQKLQAIEEQSHGSEEEYEKAKREYIDVLRRHGRVIDQLRIESDPSNQHPVA